jgi:hypothetical protein
MLATHNCHHQQQSAAAGQQQHQQSAPAQLSEMPYITTTTNNNKNSSNKKGIGTATATSSSQHQHQHQHQLAASPPRTTVDSSGGSAVDRPALPQCRSERGTSHPYQDVICTEGTQRFRACAGLNNQVIEREKLYKL